MKTNIFIPKTLKVGYQNRQGTYTGKLAYVIYYDEKNKLRKENSWQSWRDRSIGVDDFDNVPTDGFGLNKKAGGYGGWQHRQAYIRVYDPRGFEIEITVENLLYILENVNSKKEQGLEGKFVYGWDGAELILMPVDAPEYKAIAEYNDIIHENKKVYAKDLVVGGTYKTKDIQDYVYLGRFDYWDYDTQNQSRYGLSESVYKNKGKYHFFGRILEQHNGREFLDLLQLKSPTTKFIDTVDDSPSEDLGKMQEMLEREISYSPIDESATEYIKYTEEELRNIIIERSTHLFEAYITNKEKGLYKEPVLVRVNIRSRHISGDRELTISEGLGSYGRPKYRWDAEDFIAENEVYYKQKYLESGHPFGNNKERGANYIRAITEGI